MFPHVLDQYLFEIPGFLCTCGCKSILLLGAPSAWPEVDQSVPAVDLSLPVDTSTWEEVPVHQSVPEVALVDPEIADVRKLVESVLGVAWGDMIDRVSLES